MTTLNFREGSTELLEQWKKEIETILAERKEKERQKDWVNMTKPVQDYIDKYGYFYITIKDYDSNNNYQYKVKKAVSCYKTQTLALS